MKEEINKIKSWLGKGSINIFGVPFAGKDTQAESLARLLDGQVLSGGHILRNSTIPPETQKLLDEGHMMPTDDYMKIVLPFLSSEKFISKPLILSSVGRWHGEEEGVIKTAQASGHPIKVAVLLNVDEQVARQRNATFNARHRGHRPEDDPKILSFRLEEYSNKTLPVIEYYRTKGLLIEVDGNGTPEEVTEEIIKSIASFAA